MYRDVVHIVYKLRHNIPLLHFILVWFPTICLQKNVVCNIYFTFYRYYTKRFIRIFKQNLIIYILKREFKVPIARKFIILSLHESAGRLMNFCCKCYRPRNVYVVKSHVHVNAHWITLGLGIYVVGWNRKHQIVSLYCNSTINMFFASLMNHTKLYLSQITF